MERLVLSGAPDAPIIAMPWALALSQSFVVPAIDFLLSRPAFVDSLNPNPLSC